MKIAYAGDWHANTHWSVRAIEYASSQGAEVIVHLGDFGYDFRESFLNKVHLALSQARIELWFVDGNHEDFSWLYKRPIQEDGRRRITDHLYHLPRGYRWEWEGVKFLAVGGAFSVDRRWRKLNDSWWIEEEITDEDVAKVSATGKADVLISHDCPSGFVIPGIDDRNGPSIFSPTAIANANIHRWQLRKIVDATQPREIWHGHYHVRYDTQVDFNYGPVEVHGLDMDATAFETNVVLVDLPKLETP